MRLKLRVTDPSITIMVQKEDGAFLDTEHVAPFIAQDIEPAVLEVLGVTFDAEHLTFVEPLEYLGADMWEGWIEVPDEAIAALVPE